MKHPFLALVLLGTHLFFSTGCSKSTSPAASSAISVEAGLAALPSISGMVAANPARLDFHRAVVGTPPLVKDLKKTNWNSGVYISDANDANTLFFGGSLVDLLNVADSTAWSALSTSQKQTIRDNFQGASGAAGGSGACYMVQDTGSSIDQLLSNGNSACYIKNLPNSVTADKILPSTPANEVFSQRETDKLVRVWVRNLQESSGPPIDMYVFVKVFGTNTVGSDTYKAELYFCQNLMAGTFGAAGGDSGPGGLESFEVNTSSGVFKASSRSGSYSSDITTYLKTGSGGNLEFDLSKEREAIYYYSQSGSEGKSQVTITPDNKIISKKYYSFSGGLNQQQSIASISGGNLQTLRFLEGAYKGAGSGGSAPSTYSWSFQGAAAFDTTSFKSDLAHPFLQDLPADFSDSFYTSPSVSAPIMTSYPCDATPEITLEADFNLPPVGAVKELCDGDRLNSNGDETWKMCSQAQDEGKEMYLWQPD